MSSVIADSKKNWLEQVKDDAERITQERLDRDFAKINARQEKIDAVPEAEIVSKKGK